MRRTLGIRLSFLTLCSVIFTDCCGFAGAGCSSKSMPPPPSAVTLTPMRGGAVTGQSVTFAATVQNDAGAAGVSWTTSGGAFTSQSTTSATLTAPNATGNVTVTATSVADSTKTVA